jgi:hypothetical protein
MTAAFRRLLVDGLQRVAGYTECVQKLLEMLEEPGGMFNVLVEPRPGHRANSIAAWLACAKSYARHGTGRQDGLESTPAAVRTDP